MLGDYDAQVGQSAHGHCKAARHGTGWAAGGVVCLGTASPIRGRANRSGLGFPNFPTYKNWYEKRASCGIESCHKLARFRTRFCSWKTRKSQPERLALPCTATAPLLSAAGLMFVCYSVSELQCRFSAEATLILQRDQYQHQHQHQHHSAP